MSIGRSAKLVFVLAASKGVGICRVRAKGFLCSVGVPSGRATRFTVLGSALITAFVLGDDKRRGRHVCVSDRGRGVLGAFCHSSLFRIGDKAE